MKKLILLSILFVCGLANATGFMYLLNGQGGRIIFTLDVCETEGYPNLRHVFSTSSTGRVVTGCYVVDNRYNTVEVVWLINGRSERRSYPVSDLLVGNSRSL